MYLDEDNAIPVEYLATVFYWLKPDSELEKLSSKYNMYNLSIVALHDWVAPTWESLSVPQRLPTDLAKSIISGFAKILTHASLTINIGKVLMICWRIVCGAASSHLFSHASPVNDYDGVPYTSTCMNKLGVDDDDEPNYTAGEAKRLF
ncbi:CHD5 domain protein [Ceratobasidium sp. AG-Ba]|nr:CHD5 domain protein [Ceratobasidium sp. AG-Ba]QRW02576.1 CHD5 domain protein [Ceratobasidium sp. AG-Ba]